MFELRATVWRLGTCCGSTPVHTSTCMGGGIIQLQLRTLPATWSTGVFVAGKLVDAGLLVCLGISPPNPIITYVCVGVQ